MPLGQSIVLIPSGSLKAELSVTSALETGNDEGEASYNRLHGAIPIHKANTK